MSFIFELENIFTPVYDQELTIEGLVFFTADDDAHEAELWTTGGNGENNFYIYHFICSDQIYNNLSIV